MLCYYCGRAAENRQENKWKEDPRLDTEHHQTMPISCNRTGALIPTILPLKGQLFASPFGHTHVFFFWFWPERRQWTAAHTAELLPLPICNYDL